MSLQIIRRVVIWFTDNSSDPSLFQFHVLFFSLFLFSIDVKPLHSRFSLIQFLMIVGTFFLTVIKIKAFGTQYYSICFTFHWRLLSELMFFSCINCIKKDAGCYISFFFFILYLNHFYVVHIS